MVYLAQPPKKPTGRPTRKELYATLLSVFANLRYLLSELEELVDRENKHDLRKYARELKKLGRRT